MTSKKAKKKAPVRTHTPRPDELTRESFEFIAAIDHYKRRNMRSFLEDHEVLHVVGTLGYAAPGGEVQSEPTEAELEAYAEAKRRYRFEQGRLFPTWSEVLDLLLGLGYRRGGREDAA